MEKLVGIGAAAKLTGLSERTLRYWESLGLILPSRMPSGHRKYSKANVKKIIQLKEMLEKNNLRINDLVTSSGFLQDEALKAKVQDPAVFTVKDGIAAGSFANDTGGADLIEGNAGADVLIGGVNNGGVDELYGDRKAPNATTIANDGDDVLLGDNGKLDFTFGTDTERATLERYPADDGTPIPTLVRTPKQCAARLCPVVVSFHGGPEAQALPPRFEFGAGDDFQLIQALNHLKGQPVIASAKSLSAEAKPQ